MDPRDMGPAPQIYSQAIMNQSGSAQALQDQHYMDSPEQAYILNRERFRRSAAEAEAFRNKQIIGAVVAAGVLFAAYKFFIKS